MKELYSKYGLVLEGGAMRGMFTAGVMDVMMSEGLSFDGVVGVSAGAAFGCNYKSHQIGRALRYNQLMAREWRYCSLRSLITTGDLFGADFAYHYVPTKVDIFDHNTYDSDTSEFHVVATDVESGKAIYQKLEHIDYEGLEWIRASASMPLCSRFVELDGHKLLDGGVADSIPLQYFEQKGYDRNIVVLTQPLGYQKKSNRLMPLMRLSLRHYPNMVNALANRHIMYNRQLEYVAQAEQNGSAMVIRPPYDLPIGHTCHDPQQMQRVYDIGQETARERLAEMKGFLSPQSGKTTILVGFMKDGNLNAIRRNNLYYIRAIDRNGNRINMDVANTVSYVLLHTEHSDIRWLRKVTGTPFAISGNDVRAMGFATSGRPDTQYVAYTLSTDDVSIPGFNPWTVNIADRTFKPYLINI